MSLLFEIRTPIGVVARCARAYWELIVIQKHPDLTGLEDEVRQVLATPQ